MTLPDEIAYLHKLTDQQREWVEACNICVVNTDEGLVALCAGHASRFQADNPEAIQEPEPDPGQPDGEPGEAPLDIDMGLHYARLAVQSAMENGDGTQFTAVTDGLIFAGQALRNFERFGMQLTQWADKQPDRLVRRVANPNVAGMVAGFNEEGELVLFVPGQPSATNGSTP